MASESETRTLIETRILEAFDSNRAYLGLNNPTNAQNLAQLRSLTRQFQYLLRERLGRLDTLD